MIEMSHTSKGSLEFSVIFKTGKGARDQGARELFPTRYTQSHTHVTRSRTRKRATRSGGPFLTPPERWRTSLLSHPKETSLPGGTSSPGSVRFPVWSCISSSAKIPAGAPTGDQTHNLGGSRTALPPAEPPGQGHYSRIPKRTVSHWRNRASARVGEKVGEQVGCRGLPGRVALLSDRHQCTVPPTVAQQERA